MHAVKREREAHVDGRRARSLRTRRAIVDALLDLVEDGELEPTAAQIAARAGIAVRSIGQHFASREQLFLAAVEAHTKRVAPTPISVPPTMPLRERIAIFAEVRGRELEATAPIRRASAFLDSAPRPARAASAIGRATDAAWARRRGELAHVFARELKAADDRKALLDALDLLAHGRTWDTLRHALRLSPAEATAMLRRALATLLAHGL
ncbi:MAG: TetR family transcriptional regulator [Deltaproteobacteria bacterium]|nr:TetR family transcriptional regulator [Deltaproteobacteria bacterium]